MKTLFSLLALAGALMAQTAIAPNFTSVPNNNTQRFDTSETLNAAATRICSASNLVVTRTSGTVLSVANGASSAARQYIRFNPKTRVITAASTLTLSSGTGTGLVSMYGTISATGAVSYLFVNASTNVLTASTGVVQNQPGPDPAPGSILFYTWTITAGAFDVTAGNLGGVDQQTPTDCWVDMLTFASTAGGSVTVTDSQGTPILGLSAVVLAANTTLVISWPGGRFFDGGMQVNAGAANTVDANMRGTRLRRSAQNP